MRRSTLALLAATLVAGPALGADLDDILKRGSIRFVAAADEDPLMFSIQGGTNPGFERELAESFAALHKLKLETYSAKTYDDRIPSLSRGDGDVVIGIIETEARRKLVDFTTEVLPARHVVVNRKPAAPIASVEAFKVLGKVGLLKGTTWAAAAMDAGLPATAVESFTDRDAMIEAVKTGDIDATVMSVSDAALQMKKNPQLQIGTVVGAVAKAGWAVRKGDAILLKALDQYLENARKSGAWSRLVAKYFGEQALAVLGRK